MMRIPKMYRSMLEEDGVPRLGRSAKTLGVRISGDTVDVGLDEEEHVISGGMSVARDWRDLPPHRIPRRLRNTVTGASGRPELKCWRLGDDDFAAGPVLGKLKLNVNSGTHGQVEPDSTMPLNEYENELAATQSHWVVDED